MSGEMADMEAEYAVLRPTIRGGLPDRIDAYQDKRLNTRANAEREVTKWREKGERAYVVVQQWELWKAEENRPYSGPPVFGLCAWCDDPARGSAFHGRSNYWYPSCGRLLHGSEFEPTDKWRTPVPKAHTVADCLDVYCPTCYPGRTR